MVVITRTVGTGGRAVANIPTILADTLTNRGSRYCPPYNYSPRILRLSYGPAYRGERICFHFSSKKKGKLFLQTTRITQYIKVKANTACDLLLRYGVEKIGPRRNLIHHSCSYFAGMKVVQLHAERKVSFLIRLSWLDGLTDFFLMTSLL